VKDEVKEATMKRYRTIEEVTVQRWYYVADGAVDHICQQSEVMGPYSCRPDKSEEMAIRWVDADGYLYIEQPQYKWRIVARYKQWIGKSDPSNFGQFFVYSNDPSWLHEHANKLKSRGHKVYRIEKVLYIGRGVS
jgi:hypothetical protein